MRPNRHGHPCLATVEYSFYARVFEFSILSILVDIFFYFYWIYAVYAQVVLENVFEVWPINGRLRPHVRAGSYRTLLAYYGEISFYI